MGTGFNADEVFEIAEQIERNGSSFYNHGAELVSDEVTRKLLLSLATWESRHEKLFAEMRAELLKKEVSGGGRKPQGHLADRTACGKGEKQRESKECRRWRRRRCQGMGCIPGRTSARRPEGCAVAFP